MTRITARKEPAIIWAHRSGVNRTVLKRRSAHESVQLAALEELAAAQRGVAASELQVSCVLVTSRDLPLVERSEQNNVKSPLASTAIANSSEQTTFVIQARRSNGLT